MSCIVYQVNKKTGVKYAYESISYWDKEKQQPRSRREYIGKVDPETGEIIRKGDKKESTADHNEETIELSKLKNEIIKKDERIKELEMLLDEANARYEDLADKVRNVRLTIVEELSDV